MTVCKIFAKIGGVKETKKIIPKWIFDRSSLPGNTSLNSKTNPSKMDNPNPIRLFLTKTFLEINFSS